MVNIDIFLKHNFVPYLAYQVKVDLRIERDGLQSKSSREELKSGYVGIYGIF